MSKHIHKLKRLTYKNGEQVYFCVLDCKFKVNVKAAIGKNVICNRCSSPFVMNELSIRMAKPHCNNCIRKKDETLDISRSNSFDKATPNSPIIATSVIDPINDLRNSLTKSIRASLDKANDSSRIDPSEVEDDIL